MYSNVGRKCYLSTVFVQMQTEDQHIIDYIWTTFKQELRLVTFRFVWALYAGDDHRFSETVLSLKPVLVCLLTSKF